METCNKCTTDNLHCLDCKEGYILDQVSFECQRLPARAMMDLRDKTGDNYSKLRLMFSGDLPPDLDLTDKLSCEIEEGQCSLEVQRLGAYDYNLEVTLTEDVYKQVLIVTIDDSGLGVPLLENFATLFIPRFEVLEADTAEEDKAVYEALGKFISIFFWVLFIACGMFLLLFKPSENSLGLNLEMLSIFIENSFFPLFVSFGSFSYSAGLRGFLRQYHDFYISIYGVIPIFDYSEGDTTNTHFMFITFQEYSLSISSFKNLASLLILFILTFALICLAYRKSEGFMNEITPSRGTFLKKFTLSFLRIFFPIIFLMMVLHTTYKTRGILPIFFFVLNVLLLVTMTSFVSNFLLRVLFGRLNPLTIQERVRLGKYRRSLKEENFQKAYKLMSKEEAKEHAEREQKYYYTAFYEYCDFSPESDGKALTVIRVLKVGFQASFLVYFYSYPPYQIGCLYFTQFAFYAFIFLKSYSVDKLTAMVKIGESLKLVIYLNFGLFIYDEVHFVFKKKVKRIMSTVVVYLIFLLILIDGLFILFHFYQEIRMKYAKKIKAKTALIVKNTGKKGKGKAGSKKFIRMAGIGNNELEPQVKFYKEKGSDTPKKKKKKRRKSKIASKLASSRLPDSEDGEFSLGISSKFDKDFSARNSVFSSMSPDKLGSRVQLNKSAKKSRNGKKSKSFFQKNIKETPLVANKKVNKKKNKKKRLPKSKTDMTDMRIRKLEEMNKKDVNIVVKKKGKKNNFMRSNKNLKKKKKN